MFALAGEVLGIDPGLTRCGYAVLRPSGSGVEAVALGVVRTDTAAPLGERLLELAMEVDRLLDERRPGAVALERVFFQNNARTAMSVAQASGVVLTAAARRGIAVADYTPSQVKRAVAGSGTATKAAVRSMVARRLGLAEVRGPADASDAAAVALCHLASAPLARSIVAAGGRS